jgi:SAM-dependent methyltransferase
VDRIVVRPIAELNPGGTVMPAPTPTHPSHPDPIPGPTRPNHHADRPGFAGFVGLAAALRMTIGRGPMARLAADSAGVGPADHVVDVGCGPGTAAREAARRGARVTAIDPAPVMRKVARRLTRSGASITWTDGLAEDLPLADHTATVAWSLATAHHWSDIGRGLLEARRVLEPDGRLIVIERRVHPDATGLASHGWTETQADTFAHECEAAGFADVHVEHADGGRSPLLVVRATRSGSPPVAPEA